MMAFRYVVTKGPLTDWLTLTDRGIAWNEHSSLEEAELFCKENPGHEIVDEGENNDRP